MSREGDISSDDMDTQGFSTFSFAAHAAPTEQYQRSNGIAAQPACL